MIIGLICSTRCHEFNNLNWCLNTAQVWVSLQQNHWLCWEDGYSRDGAIVRQQTEKGRTIKSNGVAGRQTTSKFIPPYYYYWYLSVASLTIIIAADRNSVCVAVLLVAAQVEDTQGEYANVGKDEGKMRGLSSSRRRAITWTMVRTITRPRATSHGSRTRTRTRAPTRASSCPYTIN